MVTEWFLDMLEAVIGWALGPLPDWNDNPLSAWGEVLGHLGDLNYYLPIGEVFTFTLGVFLIFPALVGVNFIVWLVALIRGGSARG